MIDILKFHEQLPSDFELLAYYGLGDIGEWQDYRGRGDFFYCHPQYLVKKFEVWDKLRSFYKIVFLIYPRRKIPFFPTNILEFSRSEFWKGKPFKKFEYLTERKSKRLYSKLASGVYSS